MKRFSEGLRKNFCESCKIPALNLFDISRSSRCVLLLERRKLLTRAAGSYELWSLFALLVIVYLGNKFVLRKSLCFSLLSSF